MRNVWAVFSAWLFPNHGLKGPRCRGTCPKKICEAARGIVVNAPNKKLGGDKRKNEKK